MEGLPKNYRDNITVDNGVEIVWVNQKGQVIPKADERGGSPASAADDTDVVVGMPRVVSIRRSAVETEVNGTPPASPGGTRRMSVAGTVSPSPQLIGTWFTNGPDSGGGGGAGSPTGSTAGPPETEDDDADPEGHPCMALEPYARDMYNTVRKGLLGKKRTPMETLLSWKGKHITVPLTIACNQNKTVSSECVSLFGDMMVYMGDKKGKESGMQLLKGLQTRLLASDQDLRDEIFCQVHLAVVVCRLKSASADNDVVRKTCTSYDTTAVPYSGCQAFSLEIIGVARQNYYVFSCVLCDSCLCTARIAFRAAHIAEDGAPFRVSPPKSLLDYTQQAQNLGRNTYIRSRYIHHPTDAERGYQEAVSSLATFDKSIIQQVHLTGLLFAHQVCKQTTSNPDASSDLRGWQLLLSTLAVATPSKALVPYFKKHCELGPVGSIPQTYAQYALSALHKVGEKAK